MAEYIDRQQIEDYLKINADILFKSDFEIKELLNKLYSIPIADVVPRSEIEKLTEERDRYKKYYFRHEYDKWEAEIKQEVAREMCELVKRFFEAHYYLEKPKRVTIENLHIEVLKKYSFESCEVERFIAELKKKYAGEKK